MENQTPPIRNFLVGVVLTALLWVNVSLAIRVHDAGDGVTKISNVLARLAISYENVLVKHGEGIGTAHQFLIEFAGSKFAAPFIAEMKKVEAEKKAKADQLKKLQEEVRGPRPGYPSPAPSAKSSK